MVNMMTSLHNDGNVTRGEGARQMTHHHRQSDNQPGNFKVLVKPLCALT